MTAERRRQLRGAVVHMVRRGPQAVFRRDMVGVLWQYVGTKRDGRCEWCRQPCGKSRRWHGPCAAAYRAARGLVTTAGYQRPLIAPGPCELCGAAGAEIDHRVALSVAHELGHRHAVRARLLDNLRWLCVPCHRAKTRDDRRELARLRRGEQFPLLAAIG